MEIRKLSFAMGAEIKGVDIERGLSDAQWEAIYNAWLEHIFIVIPRQNASPEKLIEFAARFGALDDHSEDPASTLPGYPEIFLIGNHMVNGRMSKTKDTGRVWHSDHSYTTRPTKISMLHCREIPPAGGTTLLSNLYMAYDALSDAYKQVLENLEAVHDFLYFHEAPHFFWQPNLKNRQKIIDNYPPVAHPIVRTHPETKKKCLYVSEGQMRTIHGMHQEEAASILQYVFKHSTRPEFTYRHNYERGDLVFWDNRCSQHIAPADYVHNEENLRLMYRLTVLGESCGTQVSR
mgnify:CR=1 FL=1